MPFPVPLLYDPQTLQDLPINTFPQNLCEYCVIVHYTGGHPDKFFPNYDSQINNFLCHMNRWYVPMFYIPATTRLLRRSNIMRPFCTTEKTPPLLGEIIALFTPQGGFVVDPYTGTLTTAWAYLKERIFFFVEIRKVTDLRHPWSVLEQITATVISKQHFPRPSPVSYRILRQCLIIKTLVPFAIT